METHPVALILESECIGCTKCIQVCPVDAIIGSAKKMHTIMADDCTGCNACVDICPVQCISLTPLEGNIDWEKRAKIAEINTQNRLNRLATQAEQKRIEREIATRNRNIKLEIQACVQRKKALLEK